MGERQNRDLAIDLIKTFAIFGVLVIHVDAGILMQGGIGSLNWCCGLFWGSIVRASVSLFLMASGAIMLDVNKKFSLKKLYFHNIARIVVAMLVWGFCYKLYHLFIAEQINLQNIWFSVKRLLLFDQEFHFYYIHIILLVYAVLPITRIFVERADRKTLSYALCIWIVLGILYPTLRKFSPFSLLAGIPVQWMINLTYASVGYGVFGYYLKRYPLKTITGAIYTSLGLAITFGATFYLSTQNGQLNDMFLQGTSPGVFLLATGIFVLARNMKIKDRFEKTVIYVSKASFCIYLSHIFILYILQHFGITAQIFPAIISVPLVAGIIMLVCLIIYAIISKIPLLNKWII